jgi:hypothetical protein
MKDGKMSELNIDTMTPAQLLEFYNQHSGKAPIKKFKDKATAIKQVSTLASKIAADEAAKGGSADASEGDEAPPIPLLKKDQEMAKKARENAAKAKPDTADETTATKAAAKGGSKKASKAAAKGGSKKASKAAAKAPASGENGASRRGPRGPRELPKDGSIVERFGARPGSVREKLLKALSDKRNFGKQVERDKLAMAVYGKATKDEYGPLTMTIKGAEKTIVDHDLPFKIVKGERGASYGLYEAK